MAFMVLTELLNGLQGQEELSQCGGWIFDFKIKGQRRPTRNGLSVDKRQQLRQ
jgi:hypothetical protein